MRIASEGSRDSIAALHSDFGRALLQLRGLAGSDLEGTLSSSRKIIAEGVEANPGRHSAAEIRAAKLYKAVGALEASLGAASFAAHHHGIRA